ncbi:MAG: hypothetical protein FWG77_07800 [Treponema sp.]|nr:hypothetical protein [Treponema sp.]
MKRLSVFLVLSLFITVCLIAQTAQSPRELRLGGVPVSGTLQSGSEIWYSVRPSSNGFIIIETTGNTDTYLDAYDERRNFLMEDDDGGEGINARIEIYAEAGRTYLFKLRGFGSHSTGPYQIWASSEPVPVAIQLISGTERQVSHLPGARNWFSVRTTAAGYLVVETFGNEIDTFMDLYDSGYNLLNRDDDGGMGLNARIEILAEPNQTYYFMVRGWSDITAGSYTILAVHEPIPQDTDRNTERGRAVAIRLGEAIPVYFRAINESRWYRYDITRPGTVFVVQTRGNLDTTLLLYDSRGVLIAEDNYSGDYPNNALIYERLNPGTYLIEVRTYTNGVGVTGRCTLHAETR